MARHKRKFPNHDPKIKGDAWGKWKTTPHTKAEWNYHTARERAVAIRKSRDFIQRYLQDPMFREQADDRLDAAYWLSDGPTLPQHAERRRKLVRRERIAFGLMFITVSLIFGLIFSLPYLL